MNRKQGQNNSRRDPQNPQERGRTRDSAYEYEYKHEYEGEHLEEFRFLFEGVSQAARAEHPPLPALVEYARGLRPAGIDPQGWGTHAISAHVALCSTCRRKLNGIRRRERLRALLGGPARLGPRGGWGQERWRRAYQYLGILLLVGGIFLAYSLWQGTTVEPPPGGRPPPPAGERTGDTPGVG